ncbi:MAG: LysR family transcriptional regulator [Verrucomicrobiota bacterium]
MDTRLLRIFSAVAKHGALPPASRELHLTASALSHGLKALESQLGARLFDRVGKRLVLNHAGEQLMEQIAEPLAALDRAGASIKALGKWGHGRVRLGAPEAVCRDILPKVLRDLHRAFSRLFVSVEIGETAELLELLRADKLDLVLGVQPEPASDLEVLPWFEDELLFAFSAEHPWSDGRSVSAQETATQAFISYSRNSLTGQMIDRFFGAQNIELNAIMEVRHVGAIKQLVNSNLGAAIMAPWVLEPELVAGQVKMRPLGPKPLRRRWAIIHQPRRRLGLAEEELVKLCRRYAAGMRLDRKDLPADGQARGK